VSGAKPSTSFSWRSASPDPSRSLEPPLNARHHLRRLTLIAATCWLWVLAGATPAAADSPLPLDYRTAVEDAYSLIQNAAPNDTTTAGQAFLVLQEGTGLTQPEILSDLQAQPPAFRDATARLKALLAALDRPVTTSNPASAQQRLHDVLSMHRYDALRRAPSLLDRFKQWVGDRINDLLKLLFGGGRNGPRIPALYFYAVGLAAVAAVAFVVFRSTRGRFSEGAVASAPSGPRAPADYFAEADRMAARGDRVGAIRALCAGVAATLAGERTWEGSPLTVREIFNHSPDPTRLRPLLNPFEAAIYGGRVVDEEAYELARQVAAPFRQPVEMAA
jgi:hypothetical protein